MNKRTLIIGGTGLLGRALVNCLKNSRHVTVGSRRAQNDFEVESVFVDLVGTEDIVQQLAGFDCVINCVGQITSPIQESAYLNTAGILRLSRAAKIVGVEHFVHVSSSAVYGAGEQLSERSPLNPLTPYGALKFAAEQMVLSEFSDALIVRPTNLFSTQASAGLFSYLVRQYSSGTKRVTFNNNGYMNRQYLHVSDAAKLISRLVEEEVVGAVNVVGPETLNVHQMLDLFYKHLNINFESHFSDQEVASLLLSDYKINKILNPTFECSVTRELNLVRKNS